MLRVYLQLVICCKCMDTSFQITWLILLYFQRCLGSFWGLLKPTQNRLNDVYELNNGQCWCCFGTLKQVRSRTVTRLVYIVLHWLFPPLQNFILLLIHSKLNRHSNKSEKVQCKINLNSISRVHSLKVLSLNDYVFIRDICCNQNHKSSIFSNKDFFII